MIREYPKRGELLVVGGKIYALCGDCDSLVRINKPLFGSMHICLTPGEIAAKKQEASGLRGLPPDR